MSTTQIPGGDHRLLDVAQVVRDGGGTAPVELTVAAKLRDRGHRITLYGPPEVGDHARAAGFDLEVLDWPPEAGPDIARNLMGRMAAASEAWGRDLAPRLGGSDVVVADCMVFGALVAAKVSGVRCAAVLPTVYLDRPSRPENDDLRDGVNRARSALGLGPVRSLTAQMLDVDRLLVLSCRAFELPEVGPPDRVRYVGPQLPRSQPATGFMLPTGDQPLILVSLSTTDQGHLDLLRRLLAAIGRLPVRALVTIGPAVDPDRLDPPANVVLAPFVPHSVVLPHTSLVLTHAGHGTVMAALSAGVPLVCLPMSRDQPAVAARVAHHGLGVTVDPDADVAALGMAINQVLREPSYARAAQRMAQEIEPADRVVEEVEALAGEDVHHAEPVERGHRGLPGTAAGGAVLE